MVKLANVPFWIKNFKHDGEEINFGKGGDGTIELPDSRICNLHLAVARVVTASGLAEVVEKIMKDGDGDGSINFGDDLSKRLATLLVWG